MGQVRVAGREVGEAEDPGDGLDVCYMISLTWSIFLDDVPVLVAHPLTGSSGRKRKKKKKHKRPRKTWKEWSFMKKLGQPPLLLPFQHEVSLCRDDKSN
jgi:hypothetical protein